MNKEFNLKSGMQYVPVTITDENGEKIKIGVAVYDLNDTTVKARLIEFYKQLKETGVKYENLAIDPKNKLIQYDKEIDKLKEALEKEENNSIENTDKLDELDNKRTEVFSELAQLDEKCVDEMVALIDKIFQQGFCEKALGNTKNPNLIMELIEYMMEDYQVKTEAEINKYTNREQRRASSKK